MRGITTIIGSTPFEDLERNEIIDDELMITAAYVHSSKRSVWSMEDDLIDAALSEEEA